MSRWLLTICCALGFAVSAVTLYSTNQTLQQMKRITGRRAEATPVSRLHRTPARPALRSPAVGSHPATENVPQVGTVTSSGVDAKLTSAAGPHVVQAEGLAAAGDDPAAGTPAEAMVDQAPAATPWQPIVEQIFRPKRALSEQETQAVKAAITPVSETERVVNRQTVLNTLKDNPFQVLHEAALQPAFAAGALVGVQLASMQGDGILEQSGFKSGDIVRTVNGQPVSNPAQVLTLPQQLLSAEVVEVQVERNGQPITLKFHLH